MCFYFLSLRISHHTPAANMVEKFVGTWKMISSDNFDDYMKAIGKKKEFKHYQAFAVFKLQVYFLYILCKLFFSQKW